MENRAIEFKKITLIDDSQGDLFKESDSETVEEFESELEVVNG